MSKLDYSKIFLKDAVPTSIGGQAVMEGIMMQGPSKRALAVRLPDGEIYIKTEDIPRKSIVMKIPLLRGVFAFFVSLITGMKVLMDSADILEEHASDEYWEESGKFEKWVNKNIGPKAAWNIMMTFSVFLALIITILVFVIAPTVIINWMQHITQNTIILNLFEGLLRILFFILYILAIRKMPDIMTLFRYHGAEHKTIHCFENGLELTPANAQSFYTLHPRCGTSFLVFVFIIALLVFSFLGWPSLGMRIASRLLLLPVIAGVSYELLKWAGRSDNVVVKVLSYPGLMLQKLTTAVPDDSQLEVAIAALEAVLDKNSTEDETEVKEEPEKIEKLEPRRPKGKRYSSDPGTVEHALSWGADTLAFVENGRNEARIIFSYLTGYTREDIVMRRKEMLPENVFHEYERLIQKRLTGTPLQYITKVQEFYGLPFKVNPSVLIPRLDTEILAEQVIGLISGKGWTEPEVLDLCTGSGVLGITIAHEVPGAKLMLADVDMDAMSTAIGNARMNGVDKRCNFVIGDLFNAIPEGRMYDVIVSNPPYIPSEVIETLSIEVKEHEPRLALDGGADGLDFYRRIAAEAGAHIKTQGILALEIGCEQGMAVSELLRRSGDYKRVAVIKDLAGLDRIVIAERR